MHLDARLLQVAQTQRARLLGAIGSGVAGGVLAVAQAWLVATVLDAVFLQGADLADCTADLAWLLAAIVARGAMRWGEEILGQATAARVKSTLRRRLMRRTLSLAPLSHGQQEDPDAGHSDASPERQPDASTERQSDATSPQREPASAGSLANTVVDGIEALDGWFSQYLPQLALSALVPLTVVVFVLVNDAISAAVMILTAPLIPLFMVLIGGLAQARSQRQWVAVSRLSAHFLDVVQGLPTLKIFDRARAQARIIAEMTERYRSATMSVLKVAFLSSLALELLATLSTAVVAVEIGVRLLYAQIEFRYAFFVLLLAPEFYLPLRLLGTRFHTGVQGVTAAKAIFRLLDGEETTGNEVSQTSAASGEVVHASTGAPPKGAGLQRRPHDSLSAPLVTTRDLSVRYPGCERPVVEHVELRIAPGETLALLGPSGSGKSTIARALVGLVPPFSGSIEVDGAPLVPEDTEDWQRRVAWVPQRPYLMAGSIADNLLLGRPDASRSELREVVEQVRLDALLERLPQGLDTPLGEGGARLSKGQGHRIALARALLRRADFVVLDEVTAAVDPATESSIIASLGSVLEGRTVLVIAHRLSVLALADRCAVVDGGRVIQQGTPSELVRAEGPYQTLMLSYGGAA